MNDEKKKIKILKMTEVLLAFSFVLFLVGIYLNSYESQLNANIKETQDKISEVQSDIDALEMSKQELASFFTYERCCNKERL